MSTTEGLCVMSIFKCGETFRGLVEHVENKLQYGETLPNYQGTRKSLGDTEANKIGN